MSTPEYMKRAAQNYREKFDLIQIRLPKGTKEKILESHKSVNQYVNELIEKDLQKKSDIPF